MTTTTPTTSATTVCVYISGSDTVQINNCSLSVDVANYTSSIVRLIKPI
ncbi:hypothetical protein [Bacillus phage SP8]|nr:hypothetical protein [Bacillus phage SP8]